MILATSGARRFTIRMRIGFTRRFIGGAYFGFGLGINMGFISEEAGAVGADGGGIPDGATGSVIVNNSFIHRNNFNAAVAEPEWKFSTWSHDSSHRGAYPMRMLRCPAVTEATCGRTCNPAARRPLHLERRNREALILIRSRSGTNGQSAGCTEAHPVQTGALSAVFGMAARRGRRAITDIRASAQPGAEASGGGFQPGGGGGGGGGAVVAVVGRTPIGARGKP
jgi:hypothetical protein